MKSILVLALSLLSLTALADSSITELYMPNDAGGYVVLTTTQCNIENPKNKGFSYRAYATESNGSEHEGCWFLPDMKDAPQSNAMMKIIPIVNVWFDNEIHPYPQEYFSPNKAHGDTI